MKTNRRTFLQSSAAAGIGLGVAGCSNSLADRTGSSTNVARRQQACIRQSPALKPMTADVKPITRDERAARVQKAQRLMAANKISAIFLEGGSSMFYFTGVRWGLSERPFVCGDSGEGRASRGCARLRGRARARAGGEERRSARVAGRRESVPADRRHPQGPRRRQPAASASKSGCASSSSTA